MRNDVTHTQPQPFIVKDVATARGLEFNLRNNSTKLLNTGKFRTFNSYSFILVEILYNTLEAASFYSMLFI